MPDFASVGREHVLQALQEYDELGAVAFLDRYGFGTARQYVLWHEGKSYDSKAILGAAHKYATGTAARASDFSGGKEGAAKVLRGLGFDVVPVGDDDEFQPAGGWRDASEIGTEAARRGWAESAREVLIEVADRYHAVITYSELAREVQQRTGIRTRQLMRYWIGNVLFRVAEDCVARGEPLLAALCVHEDGSVGEGYAIAVRDAYGVTPADPDDHAAAERLACHRHFHAADLPADGGHPALTPKLEARRTRSRKTSSSAAPLHMCPTCHMQLPATGVCDNCD